MQFVVVRDCVPSLPTAVPQVMQELSRISETDTPVIQEPRSPTISWVTLCKGFNPSASDSSSVRDSRSNTMATWALSPGPCQAQNLLGSNLAWCKHQVTQDSKFL